MISPDNYRDYRSFLMQYEVKFLSIAVVTVQNFNRLMRKKGHKKIINGFLNRLLVSKILEISFRLQGFQL